MEEATWGADFSGMESSIPMIDADFPRFTSSKAAHISRHLSATPLEASIPPRMRRWLWSKSFGKNVSSRFSFVSSQVLWSSTRKEPVNV
ncbi:hypothetical protein [Ktedonobacter racemifer]|uniref:hypothetical protein n=1 Tax=Ktedonobacter racemifer TaxID=363277 RepID=UPI0012F9DA73|nr:hypothetical protein [Ktedonobacter racemifer]